MGAVVQNIGDSVICSPILNCRSMRWALGFGNKAGHLVFTWAAAAPTTPSLARSTASLPCVTCSQPRSVRGLVGRRLTIARDRLCLPTASRADCAESALNAPSPARGRADTHAVACAQHGFVAVRGVLPAAELVAPRRRRGSYCPSAAPHVRAERGRPVGATLDEAFVSRAPRASTRATSAPRRAYAAAFAKARAAPHPHSRSILAQFLSAASDVCLAHKPPHLAESIKSALATPAVVGSGLAVGGRSHRRVVLIRVGPARVCHWLHVAGQKTCGVEYSL